ncbi:hypothetical protein A8C56_01155 [Niabella ginsenosidivorans]|uniref:Uncharacterized protein n=1 Tax=Niabella ginsenosidivorans TaxID=1176587 RepID=A0A1A9HWZ4_9BACT|nr:hypothetical protein A8C56_01155 [Niabella ginsenosidivorans]
MYYLSQRIQHKFSGLRQEPVKFLTTGLLRKEVVYMNTIMPIGTFKTAPAITFVYISCIGKQHIEKRN